LQGSLSAAGRPSGLLQRLLLETKIIANVFKVRPSGRIFIPKLPSVQQKTLKNGETLAAVFFKDVCY